MNALAAIRDSGKPSQRLYRDTHDTFEEYCRDRWGFSKSRANQFIDASSCFAALEMTNFFAILPSTESHVAQLTRCESDDQAAEVWQQVVDDADENMVCKMPNNLAKTLWTENVPNWGRFASHRFAALKWENLFPFYCVRNDNRG